MRRICVLNQKGGVGKTTTTANLGAALARAGRRVVVIDLDPQGNLSTHLGIEVASGERSSYSVLIGECTLAQAARPTTTPGLRVVPTGIDLSGAEMELATMEGREHVLRRAIDAFEDEARRRDGASPAEYVLVDCPPSLGMLSINAMVASREVFVALQTEFLALQGMTRLLEVVQLVKQDLNPRLKVTGIVPCLYDSRLRLAREVLGELRSYFPQQCFRRPISATVKLAEAPSFGQSIFEYAPDSSGARDYRELAEEVVAQEKRPVASGAEDTLLVPHEAPEKGASEGASGPASPSGAARSGASAATGLTSGGRAIGSGAVGLLRSPPSNASISTTTRRRRCARRRAEFLRVLDLGLGNPSSVHASGRRARQVIDEARERVAAALHVDELGVVFTSGGTESIHLALRGAAALLPDGAVATTAIEHAAVLGAVDALTDAGRTKVLLEIDGAGRLDVAGAARRAAESGARLVSVGLANNEIGTVQDVAALAAALAELPHPPVLHTDAVQALGRLPIDLSLPGPQLMSFSAHKVGGPLGVGVLAIRGGARVAPLLAGGGQELGLRGGTENAAAVSAAAVAIELAVAEREGYAARTRALTRELWAGIAAGLPGARLLGPAIDAPDRLPNTLNVLTGRGGSALIARLDLEGVEASAGSACASGSVEPSHVLLALGLDDEEARRGLRLSLGRRTGADEVRRAVEILCTTCRALGDKTGTTR
ncbi:MAG: aminotransferase class V-fold PLP-dependent enzyme [Planctomycetota bacterium]